jgi:hypothetical protein
VTTQRIPIRLRTAPVDAEPPPLFQFVVLSMLLHLLVVIVFGNPTGTARRGDGWWGPLNVSLQRLLPDAGSGLTLAPGADTNAPGTERLRRRERATAAAAASDASAGGGVTPPGDVPGAPEEPAPPTDTTPGPAPAAAAPIEPLPHLDLDAVETVDTALSPSVTPNVESPPAPAVDLKPREVALPPMAPLQRIVPPKIDRELTAPVTVPRRVIPIAPIAPIERLAPLQIDRALAPPVTVPPREIPIAPIAPIERIAPAKVDRELAPPVTVPPREIPIAPIAPIERIAPAKVDRELSPPVTVPPREIPVAPVAPIERLVSPQIDRVLAPPVILPRAAPVAPVERIVPPEGTREAGAAAQSPPHPEPATTPPSRLRFGSPEVEDEVFKPRGAVVTPSPNPGGAPRIDLEAARRRAREITSESSGSRGIVSLVPPPPAERKSKLAEDMEKAAKPDCRTAYAGLGLLAIPALVGSAIGNGGCNW